MSKKIYTLKLEHGAYYVGKSNNVTRRVEEHKKGNGAQWTKLHPVIDIESVVEGDDFDEDRILKKLMAEKGINNVRGGSYPSIVLTPSQLDNLTRELQGAADKCWKCGKKGHFATECENLPEEKTAKCGRDSNNAKAHKNTSTPVKASKESLLCTKCGRNTHSAISCYAKTHQNGSLLVDEEKPIVKELLSCAKCGRNNHTTKYCYARTDTDGNSLTTEKPISDKKNVKELTSPKEQGLNIVFSMAEDFGKYMFATKKA